MSVKILAFGETGQVSLFLDKSQGQPNSQEEAVIAQTVRVADQHYLLFAIKDRQLVGEQAAGTNGLIFFLNRDHSLSQEKQFLIELIESRPEFDGLPIAVLFERGKDLSLKDVVNFMQLYRLKDRASMIKEFNWEDVNWLQQLYGWIRVQNDQGIKRGGFQAVPKIVKLKAKYRQEIQMQSQRKYQQILEETQVRIKGVKQQEQVYIEQQKDKMKRENMQKQLANFSRNKKKMAPYDIKPTPNPKIEPNLHFFLKDPHAQPPPEASIKIQTDQFKERPPAPPYRPKKTGINTATQIEENELFNFDKEVKPILSILTTKALEQAALEIEQEEEFLKMAKYKSAYQDRVRRQKDHENKNIQEEMRVMREKDKLLDKYRERNQTVKNVQKRVQCYELAGNLLSKVYLDSTNKLLQANSFPEVLSNHIATDYLDQVFCKAAKHYGVILEREGAIKGVFEKEVVEGLTQYCHKPREAKEKMRQKVEARLTNKMGLKRRVRVLYQHDYTHFSNFSKYLNRHFDGSLEGHARQRQEQIQQIYDKFQGNEATEDQYNKIRIKDDEEYAANHKGYLIDNQKEICFTWTTNRYEKTKDQLLSCGFLFMDKEGEIVDQVVFGAVGDKQKAFVRVEKGLRDPRQQINMDEGLVLDLAKVPQNIKNIVVLTKIPQAQRFRDQTEAGKIKHSAIGVEYWERNIPIHQSGLAEQIKWEEIVKGGEGEEIIESQSVITVSYFLRRRAVPECWNLEEVNYVAQPFKTGEDFDRFQDELSRHLFKSNDYLKEEEEQEKIERSSSSHQKKQRGKSRKLIEEPKKKVVLKVTSRILREVQIDLEEPFETAQKKLQGSVEEWRELKQLCQNGYQLLFRGKSLESVEVLRKFKKVGDLTVRRIPKVEEPKVEKGEGEVAKQEENDDA